MANGNVIRQAAQDAAQAHAQAQGWNVERIIVGQITVLPTGMHVVLVRILLVGGAQHCFEYRCNAAGVGGLWPVDCP